MTLETKTLPQSVVEHDHRLEQDHTNASEALAAHRWHWTLDESNSQRVSIREYARAVGRARSTIYKQANGYAEWRARAGTRALSEEIERAAVGEEKEATVEAIAAARGLSFGQVRQSRPSEVKRVRELAREAAERKGTSIADEAPTIARVIVEGEEVDRRAEVERQERTSLRYIEVERHLLSMLRAGALAQQALAGVPFDEDERELLRHTVNQVRELVHLIDARLSGNQAIDWDAELEKIMEGVG